MAEALARRALAGRPLVAGVMGSGHLRFGHGVPHQLRDLGIRNIGILLPLSPGGDCRDLRAGLADAVFMLPAQAQARPEPPRLGVQLEAHEGGVRVAAVTAGSLAEKSGLKRGDRHPRDGRPPGARRRWPRSAWCACSRPAPGCRCGSGAAPRRWSWW